MVDIYEFMSNLEDIISQNMNSIPSMYNKLKALLDPYSKEDIEEALKCDSPFGEVKLNKVILDIKAGKPMDAAYIQSLDFSEDEDLKIDESKIMSEEMFRSSVVEPTFVSDWAQYKHQMVSDFEYPEILVEEENIANSAKLDMLTSPVTLSLVDKLKGETVTSDEPEQDLDYYRLIESAKGPSLEEYFTSAEPIELDDTDDCSFCNVKSYYERINDSPLGSLISDNDFSVKFNPSSLKGYQYLSKILFNQSKTDALDALAGNLSECVTEEYRKPVDEILIIMSKKPEERLDELNTYQGSCTKPGDFECVKSFCEKNSLIDFSAGVKELADGSVNIEHIIPKDAHKKFNEIPPGDTAQERGGTSGVKKDLIKR